MSSLTFRGAVPYLGGVTTVFTAPSLLLFKHYSLRNKKWEQREDHLYLHKSSFDQVISMGLRQVMGPGSIGKTPCVLCRHRQKADMYCVFQFDLTSVRVRTNARKGSECGVMAMISGDLITDLDLGPNPCCKSWTFDWSNMQRYCTMVVMKTDNDLSFVLLSYEGGVVKRIAPPPGCTYIPSDYNCIVETIQVYWRVGYDGCGLFYTPLFVVGTSYKQLLVFENGSTLTFAQLGDIPQHLLALKISSSAFVVCVQLLNSSDIVLYKVVDTPTDPLYKAKAELMTTIAWQEKLLAVCAGDFTAQGGREQLLLITQGKDDGEVMLNLLDPLMDECSMEQLPSISTDAVSQPLVNTARALEIRKMLGNVMVDQDKKLLREKKELFAQGMAVMKGLEETKPMMDRSVIRLFGQPNILAPPQPLKPLPPEVKVLKHWQRLVDSTTWTMAFIIANIGSRSLSSFSLSLVPREALDMKGGKWSCCKMVSLVCSNPMHKLSQWIRSHDLPSHSMGCFVISTDAHLLPTLHDTTADIVCTYIATSDSHAPSNVSHTPSFHQLMVLTSIDGVSVARCAPLHSLSSVWTGQLYLEVNDHPSEQLMDLVCHLGSKRLSKIQLLPNSHYSTSEYTRLIGSILKQLPFPVISSETMSHVQDGDEFDWLLLGVCLVCSVADDIITLTVVHRTNEELNIIKNHVRKISSKSFDMV